MNIDVSFNWRAETDLCTIMQGLGSPIAGPRHSYTKLYNALFAPVRQEPLRILQFGLAPNTDLSGMVGTPAATLKGWRAYFPNATVFGADPEVAYCVGVEGAHTYEWTDPSGLHPLFEKTGIQEKYDVIVYSGPGNSSDKIIQFERLIHALKVGGVIILENISWRESLFWSMVLQKWQGLFSNIKYRPLSVPYLANREDNIVVMAQVVDPSTPITPLSIPLMSEIPRTSLIDSKPATNQIVGE